MEQKNYIPKKEVKAYALGALGQGLVYSCMSSYITDYYLNVLNLSIWFVFFLMLIARIMDAVYDPFIGTVMDRHTTKQGRMRPYAKWTAIPIAILTILMFVNPGFETAPEKQSVWLYVFVGVVYVLWGMVYSISDVPFWGLPNLMTPDAKERGRIISYGKTTNGIGSGVTVALPIIMTYILAKSENADILKYAIMAITMSAIGMPMFAYFISQTKERVQVPNAIKRDKSEPSAFKRVLSCKPLMLVVISGILSFGRYMLQAAAPHFARYSGMYIGAKPLTEAEYNTNVANVSLVIQICTAVGMFGTMLFLPKLYKKFEYKRIMIVACIGGFLASCLTIFIGWTTKNLLLCIPFLLISSIPLGVINNVSFAMISDCLDLIEWKTGNRDTGLGSACTAFVNQMGNAFATVMIILMYVFVKIDPAQLYNAEVFNIFEQLTGIQNFGMFSLVTIVPGASLLLCAVPIFFYDFMGEKKKRILEELAVLRKERGVVIDE